MAQVPPSGAPPGPGSPAPMFGDPNAAKGQPPSEPPPEGAAGQPQSSPGPVDFSPQPSDSQIAGLQVRLDAVGEGLESPVVVVLEGDGSGEGARFTLQDDGKAPDTEAGDARWVGAASVPGHKFKVRLVLTTGEIEGGEVSYGVDDKMRDLDIELRSGLVKVKASIGGQGQPPPGAPGGAAPPSGASGPASSGSGASSPAPSGDGTAQSPPGGFTSSRMPWEALAFVAVGLLGFAGLSIAWWRMRGRAPAAVRPSNLNAEPVANPGGPGLPPLSGGLQLWQLPAEQHPAVLEALVRSLAARGPVLLVGPDTTELPGAPGGPVYHSPSARPADVADAIEALDLRFRRPVSALLWGVELKALARELPGLLPEAAGAIALVADPAGLDSPLVQVEQRGPHLLLRHAEREARCALGPDGLVPLS